MSLLDDIAVEQKTEKKCGLGDALRSMEEDELKQVIDAFRNPKFQHTAITRVLKKRGYQINRFQVAECRKCVDTGCECGAL